MLVGCLTLKLVSLKTSSNNFSATGKQAYDDNRTENDFKHLAIYRGPRNPIETLINSLESKEYLYSQLGQDEIVLQLTKEIYSRGTKQFRNAPHTPFFVDLAANDALLLSNTLRLEQNGWSGLCIGINE